MQQVGTITKQIEKVLGLEGIAGTAILLGESNILHMQSSHPDDYAKYGQDIPLILASPDYVRQNPKDASLEYVKEYEVDGEYVKVAVRVSASGTWFARSLYALNSNRVKSFIERGYLFPVS